MVGKKKKIRKMRKTAMKNPNNSVSSHRMAWVGDPSKKRGQYGVFPTIAPKKGKETSTKKKDWRTQTPKEAEARGEMIKVKRKKRAVRLAAGSWKKGADRKEAMRAYRKRKKK